MRHAIKNAAGGLLPPETKRRRIAGSIARRLWLLKKAHPDIAYAEWVERTEPFTWSPPSSLEYEPLISIVVPVFNPSSVQLMSMVYSVVDQQYYTNWELILVNASTSPKAQESTKACEQIDSRIKVVNLNKNLGIAGNTNKGLEASEGEYIGLLDHDDLLAPQALFEIARCLQKLPRPQFIYSDEDKLSKNGEYRFDPFFKPDWSPYLFNQVNYTNHFTVVDKKLIDAVGGYRPGFDGAQDYDLYLRLVDQNPIIAHVPKILYHWRAAQGSTADDFSSKKYIVEAAIKALNEHLQRKGMKGQPRAIPKQPGFYQIDYSIKEKDSIALLVLPSPIADQYLKLVRQLLDSLKQIKVPTEVYVNNVPKELDVYHNPLLKLIINEFKDKKEFIQYTATTSKASIIVIVNAGVVPAKSSWLEELASIVSQDKSVGAVSPMLVDSANKFIEDAGYVLQGTNYLPLFDHLPIKGNTYFGNTVWCRDVDALSGRVVAMQREVFDKYFHDFYHLKKPEAYSIFKKLKDDGLWTVVCPNNMMLYSGELYPSTQKTEQLNPNLVNYRGQYGVAKTINISAERPYEES